MDITYAGISGALMIAATSVVRLIYLAAVNKKRYPNELFKGKYLVFLILSLLFSSSAMLVCLLTSKSISNLGLFIVWAFVAGASALIELSIWVIFWAHGYEVRYQFEKIVVVCPLVILETLIMLTTGLCALNIPLICLSVAYGIVSFIWNYKGWKLTKPDETYHREGEDDD